MAEGVVTVFGASGRQGLAQIVRLKEAGLKVRAIARDPRPYTRPFFEGCEVMAADYRDPASLDRACAGADYVFLTMPAFAGAMGGMNNAVAVGEAAKKAGVKRLVMNTSAFVPEKPVGNPNYDAQLERANRLEATGVPYTLFAPVLFMDNLLTHWAKPYIVKDGVYVYPHKPDLEANWISLDDVARFMIASLDRPDLLRQRIVLGGPETLKPADVAAALSAGLGKPIRYQMLPVRAFGEIMWNIFHDVSDMSHEAYVERLTAFYTFNNDAPLKPFKVDMQKLHNLIPMKLQTMKEWSAKQDWTIRADGPSGG